MDQQLTILATIAFAAFLGGLIGIERQIDAKSAGFRTHMFIAATAAGLISVGTLFASTFMNNVPGTVAGRGADPFRLIDAIIVGVSFMGGGVILKDEKNKEVRNLTTAASLLFTTVIGICVGAHFFTLAVGLTALALIINFGLLIVEKQFSSKGE